MPALALERIAEGISCFINELEDIIFSIEGKTLLE
jgi:hypothetical protein